MMTPFLSPFWHLTVHRLFGPPVKLDMSVASPRRAARIMPSDASIASTLATDGGFLNALSQREKAQVHAGLRDAAGEPEADGVPLDRR
jgi:hypothetical protein